LLVHMWQALIHFLFFVAALLCTHTHTHTHNCTNTRTIHVHTNTQTNTHTLTRHLKQSRALRNETWGPVPGSAAVLAAATDAAAKRVKMREASCSPHLAVHNTMAQAVPPSPNKVMHAVSTPTLACPPSSGTSQQQQQHKLQKSTPGCSANRNERKGKAWGPEQGGGRCGAYDAVCVRVCARACVFMCTCSVVGGTGMG